MSQSEVHHEEKFWTTALINALNHYDVSQAFRLADDALQLYRQLWTSQPEGARLTMSVLEDGYQSHWSGDNAPEGLQLQRHLSAREVWSASFMRAWRDAVPIFDTAKRADEAALHYGKVLGLSVNALMGDCPEDIRAHWRQSWDVIHQASS